MKMIQLLIAVCALVTAVHAGEVSEADKKWSEAVGKMIAEGATTLSTPSEARAKLAKELAAKQGRDCQIEKTEKGFKLSIQPRKLASK
jgi:hypothetical protein